MQIALGILEQRAEAAQRDYVNDVREDVQEMSNLVNELLSFSKASLREKAVELQRVPLAELARRVAAREAGSADRVQVQIDDDLTALWSEITRTARAGARVIFRTAADERLLPGRVPDDILDRWFYDEARCRALDARDRSSIYGAFHLYTLKGDAR